MGEVVRMHIERGVAVVTLTGSDQENALTSAFLRELDRAVRQAADDESCRAIVLKAQGPAFCQGMDLSIFRHGARPARADLQQFTDCLKHICRSSRPVMACVEGQVSGGGVALVAACDLVLASASATFIMPELVLGLLPALAAPFLQRRLSLARIRYLTLSSKTIDASEARALGLVDDVVADMSEAVKPQLQRLLCLSPGAVAAAKQYFESMDVHDLDRDVDGGLDQAIRWFDSGETLDDLREYAEGGVPSWFPKGRSARVV